MHRSHYNTNNALIDFNLGSSRIGVSKIVRKVSEVCDPSVYGSPEKGRKRPRISLQETNSYYLGTDGGYPRQDLLGLEFYVSCLNDEIWLVSPRPNKLYTRWPRHITQLYLVSDFRF